MLAKVTGYQGKQYKLRYYSCNKHNNSWKPGVESTWYGTCNHEAILLAGVVLTSTQKITAATEKHITNILQNDNN